MSKILGIAVLFSLAVAAFAGLGVVLSTLDGKRVNPFESGHSVKGVVFVFTRSDCPISNRYAPELERLYEKFSPLKFDFWLVYLDPGQSQEAVRSHVREYGYRLGVLLDPKHSLSGMAQARVTPEAAVYAKGEWVYRGRIDNRYATIAKARQAATEHDLEEVLDQLAAGLTVTPKSTRAVGCFIEDLK